MRTVYSTKTIDIPAGVTVDVKSREVTVTGPKGKLHRSFKHISLDIARVGDNQLKVDLWFGQRDTIAAIRLIFAKIIINI